MSVVEVPVRLATAHGAGGDLGVSAPRDVASVEPPADRTEALTALLRREQQLEAIEGTLGWWLLSYYGPYKQRFVQPMWRRLRAALSRLRHGAATSPYQAWAEFADRFRDLMLPPIGPNAVRVSVVLTVDVATRPDLAAAVAALRAQSYEGWDLHVVTVGASEVLDAATCESLRHAGDARITIDRVPYLTHAAAANAALADAHGEIVALGPATAVLATDALRVALDVLRATGGDVLYSDEDSLDDAGRRYGPTLKPGWSPDLLLSCLYWSRVVFYRASVLRGLLPLEPALDGADLYDLALRATEAETSVVHVPRILSHVHAPPLQEGALTTKEREAGRRALEAALARRGIAGRVEWHAGGSVYRVRRALRTTRKVSIIVPTRDGLAMLQRCVRAVEATDYAPYEIVIVDNGSVEPETLAFLATTSHRVVRAPGPFNFSRLNNLAVPETDGALILFLNNDTEPCDPGWLRALVEHAERPEVGAVGAKLLYADGRIQHAGVALGIGGLAGHTYRFQRAAPEGIRDVSAVTAACLLMRRETFEEVGGFDERLPVNSNDVDLCLRLRERGYLVVYTPHAVLHHYESQTRGGRAARDDAWLMTRRWREVLRADPYGNPNVDLADERGELDLSKPDGLVCLYGGTRRDDGELPVGGGETVGQRFYATGAQLCAVVVRGIVRGARPAESVRLEVRESPTSAGTARSAVRYIVGRADDELWFCFEPIADSGDRFWYFALTVGDGHTLTVRRNPVVSDVMGPCFVNEAPSHGTLAFRLYARASYRCATTPP